MISRKELSKHIKVTLSAKDINCAIEDAWEYPKRLREIFSNKEFLKQFKTIIDKNGLIKFERKRVNNEKKERKIKTRRG